MDFTNVFFSNDLLFRLDHNQHFEADKNFKHAQNFLNDLILKNFDKFKEELEKDIDKNYFPLKIDLVLNETGYRDRSIGYRKRIENRYELLEINIVNSSQRHFSLEMTPTGIAKLVNYSEETFHVSSQSEIGIAKLQLAMRKAIQTINNGSHFFNENTYNLFLDLLKENGWYHRLWSMVASNSDKFTYQRGFQSVKELNKEFTRIISFFEDNLKTIVTQDFIG